MHDKGNTEWGIYETRRKYYKIDQLKLPNNHDRAKKKSKDDIKKLNNEINDFKTSLQFTEKALKEKIKSLDKKHESICIKVDEVYDTEINS